MPAKKEIVRDADGNRITKSGKADKRSVSSRDNIMKAKEALSKVSASVPATINESDSESESEYEIEEIKKPIKQPEPVKEPEPVKQAFIKPPNDVEDRTKKWLEEQNEMRRKHDEEIFKLKEENKKLKGLNSYNDHLTRISHLAKNVSIKF